MSKIFDILKRYTPSLKEWHSVADWGYVVVAFVIISISATLNAAQYQQLDNYPFVFISEQETEADPVITDSIFNAAARGIIFNVNRTELRPGEPFIKIYNEEIVPMLLSKDLVLKGLIVRGAASPEGPWENNRRLGIGRTARLVEFIKAPLDNEYFADGDIATSSITEDYEYLVVLMRAAGDEQADTVAAMVKECGGDERCCKERLKAHNGGKTWRRLLKEYFPSLRQARVVMWFSRKRTLPAINSGITTTEFTPVCAVPTIPQPEFGIKWTRRHLIALRTNLLHDFFYMPDFGWAPSINAQLEYYPLDGHYTYNLGFTWSNHRHWNEQKFFQIRDLRLEVRRYFKGGGEFIGPYLDVYAHGSIYGIGLSQHRSWQGEGGGGGIGAGYTMALNKQKSLRLEFSVEFGAFYTRYDPYVYGNPITGDITGDNNKDYYYDFIGNASQFKKRNHQFFWLGPTNAGIHLTYDIIYRKRKPAGTINLQGGIK